MRLEELEEMMTEEPSEAEAAIGELVSTSNVEQLAHIARSGRVHELKLRAINGLGDVGGPQATAALVELLEGVKGPFLIGGTEQELEHASLQSHLVQSLARARGVPPPPVLSQEAITEFIESIRRG
jgi:hypothetical protein